MANNKIMNGKIIEVRGSPNPNSYLIESEDKTYLVHVGDIKLNEDLLYSLYNENKITTFEKGDLVEFEPIYEHAIHVKKLPEGKH